MHYFYIQISCLLTYTIFCYYYIIKFAMHLNKYWQQESLLEECSFMFRKDSNKFYADSFIHGKESGNLSKSEVDSLRSIKSFYPVRISQIFSICLQKLKAALIRFKCCLNDNKNLLL